MRAFQAVAILALSCATFVRLCQPVHAAPEAKELYNECMTASVQASSEIAIMYWGSCYGYFHGFIGRDAISVNGNATNPGYFCVGDTSAREWVASFMSWYEKNHDYIGDASGAVFRMFVEKYPCR